MSDDRLEIEVKFLVANLGVIRKRIMAAGGQLEKPRIYERNIRFDTPWQSLIRQGKLLRLRKDSAARITYKGESSESRPSEARIREEIEMEVEDFQTAIAILEKVGFQQQQLYEKYREVYHLDETEVVLDELPYGDFVEIEGDEMLLKQVANKLGLRWQKRILTNYLVLMQQLKEYANLEFENLTFDNFTGQQATISDILDYAD